MTAMTRLVVLIASSVFALSACKQETPATDAPTSDVEEAAAPTTAPGDTAQAAAAPSVSDPCTLVTADEITSALGEPAEGENSMSGGAKVCTWMLPTGRSVIVQYFSSAGRFDASREALTGFYKNEPENLPELGEKAFSVGGKTGILATSSVAALKGARFVIVQVMDPNRKAEDLKPETVDLTRTVLSRI